MPKKIITIGYIVEVLPKRSDTYLPAIRCSPEEEKRMAEGIKAQIERHVDNVQSVHVIKQAEAVCEFCGWNWDEINPIANFCCDEDIKYSAGLLLNKLWEILWFGV